MAVLGVVAAAGTSGRMGSTKALLSTRLVDDDADDVPWARAVALALREGGVDDVVVTVPDGAVGDVVAAAVGDLAWTTVNPRPTEGLTGSIVAALDLAERRGVDVEAVIVCPVDAPGLDRAVVAAVMEALGPDAPVVVVCDGRRGHPAAFPRAFFPALRRAGLAGGPRAVLANTSVREVIVRDGRVLWDLDTPAAIEEARQRRPPTT